MARMTVVVQVIANLVRLALVVRLITEVTRWARGQCTTAGAAREGDPENDLA